MLREAADREADTATEFEIRAVRRPCRAAATAAFAALPPRNLPKLVTDPRETSDCNG
jgi:hypothetical protein